MPGISKDSVQMQDHGPVQEWAGDIEGYTINIVTFKQDIDGTPMMKGLPDDRCQCPHWGYVLKGRLTFRFADRDEVYGPGDAFYLPPGHIPLADAGSEYVQFSPAAELKQTEAVLMENVRKMQAGAPA